MYKFIVAIVIAVMGATGSIILDLPEDLNKTAVIIASIITYATLSLFTFIERTTQESERRIKADITYLHNLVQEYVEAQNSPNSAQPQIFTGTRPAFSMSTTPQQHGSYQYGD